MLNLNPTTLAAVVEKAAHDAANHPRWLTAIGRAIVELDSNPYMERGELHGLIIGSPSGNLYTANGTCQCEAYKYNIPCWHRAASRLVRLHDEREAAGMVDCYEPDNGCEVHNPCPRHAARAAAYLQQEGTAIADAMRAGLVTMPEGDTLDTAGMRVARKIAAARVTAQFNADLFA